MTTIEFFWLWLAVLICTTMVFRRVIQDIRSSDTSGIFGETLLGGILGIIVGIILGCVVWALQSGIPYEDVHLGSARIGILIGVIVFWCGITLLILLSETTILPVAVLLANISSLIIINMSVYLTQKNSMILVLIVISLLFLIVWLRSITHKLYSV